MEKKLRKKLNDVNSFLNSIINIKEKITFFEDENHKSVKKNGKYKSLTTMPKSIDTYVFIATISSSITFSFTGIGLIVIPISIGIACGSTIGNMAIHEIVLQKDNYYKNNFEKINQLLNLLINYIEKGYKIM